MVHIQPRKRVFDYADYTAPTRQHELDHTDHTDHTGHTDEEYVYRERSRSMNWEWII